MKSFLSSRLKTGHLVAFGVLLLLFAGGAVALADTDAISAFWLPGQVRFSSAAFGSGDPSVDISGTGTEKVVLTTGIEIPAGKRGDIQATFSADLHHLGASGTTTYAYCFGRFSVDGASPDTKFKPDMYQLLGGDTAHEPSALTVSMSGWRKNVPAGAHTVYVYVNAAYNGCEIQAANLNVIVNIH